MSGLTPYRGLHPTSSQSCPHFVRYAFACCPTISTKLPIAALASMRCKPQSFITAPFTTTSPTISSVRASAGSPWTLIARYEPASFETHSAVSKPGTLTNGVSIFFSGVTHGFGGNEEELTPFTPVERYECSSPLPPPSAAGLTHAAAIPSTCTRPKRELAGGGESSRNETYEITQPVCV